MEINYFSKPMNMDPAAVVFKRVLIYLPLIVNLYILGNRFLPLFLEGSTTSTWQWIFSIEHIPEPLTMISFILTLLTFARNYVIKDIEIIKKEARLKVRFEGLVPSMMNLLLAFMRITLYKFSPVLVTDSTKIKLLYHGIILVCTSSISIFFSQFYVLDLYGIRLSFYSRLCKFWKYVHTLVVVSLIAYFSLNDSNILVRSVVRILCLLVSLTLIYRLLNNNNTFMKINYVESLADLNKIFLMIAFLLYFNLSTVAELRFAGKSIELSYQHSVNPSFYLAFVYYMICCRHKLYIKLNPLVNYSDFGVVSKDPLMTSAFKSRYKPVVRELSQFNFYFLKRSFGIFGLTRTEMMQHIKDSKSGFWSELLRKNEETREILESYIPTKLKSYNPEAEEKIRIFAWIMANTSRVK